MRRYCKRKYVRRIVAVLCLFVLLAGGKSVVYAEEESGNHSLDGDVALLKKEGGNYTMQVTVENGGADFTGTVQLVFACSGTGNCAYNTEITLPAQGKKQFTVTVPERAVDTVYGLCALNFLDGKGEVVESVQLKNVFGAKTGGISVGILSDDYSSLTYLDAGGMEFAAMGVESPLKLLELDGDDLTGYLDGLYFLVIDRFNMSVLDGETIQAIQDWVRDGGWLLIGTGAYGEWTLSGFDRDFLDVDILGVSDPGEDNEVSDYAVHGNYLEYVSQGIDFTRMRIAELDYDDGECYESTEHPAICFSHGDGAVMVYMSSLGEEELKKLEDYIVYNLYGELMANSYSYRSFYRNSDMEYVGKRALAFIDAINTDLDFSWLALFIGIYVVLVGPVLYLVLRKFKKSEWYWVWVPVSGLLFIAGVFFFGQGIRVNETKVYSVTVQQAEAGQAETYMLAYQSGMKPWDVCLNESYEVAGPGWSGYYRSMNRSVDDYLYTVSDSGEGLRVGIKPRENFESGFLYAGRKADKKGTISGSDIKGIGANVSGTITNGTGFDMAYVALWNGSEIMVFSDLKAGETLDLRQAENDGRCVYQSSISFFEALLYNMVYFYGYYTDLGYEQEDMAALVMGLGIADEAKPKDDECIIIVGVVRDYEPVVVSGCNEVSYGCLYSYVEAEAGKQSPVETEAETDAAD